VPEVVVVALVGTLTALATGLGAVPVFLLGDRVVGFRPFLWGLTIGLMGVAAVVGLVLPALDEDEPAAVVAGIAVGVSFLLLVRRWLGKHELSPTRLRSAGGRRALLIFLVLFVHSLPEGFAIGTAWASNREGLGLFVFLAIALQNIPEGTSIAIPMAAERFGARDQFWAAVGTSAPQPLGAVVAFLLVDQISGLLPFSFGFAAGAMLALVVFELLPQALLSRRYAPAAGGAAVGAAVMLALAGLLGV
jgi:zinc transporter, ZIP family